MKKLWLGLLLALWGIAPAFGQGLSPNYLNGKETWPCAIGGPGGPGTFCTSNLFRGYIGSSAPAKMVFLGDSITANAAFITTTNNEFADYGFATWLRRFLNGRVYSPISYNFGVPGWVTSQILSQVPQALALNPDICVVMGGRNDAQSGLPIAPDTTPGTTEYNLRQIYDQLQAGGCTVVAIKVLSQTFSMWPAASNELNALQINNWIETQKSFRRNFLVVDNGNTYDDQTSVAHWQPKLGYINTADNTHPAQWGSWAIGQNAANQISTLLPNWRLSIQNVDDVYDPVNNPGGNLLLTQMFQGTGGNSTGCTTGTSMATNWVTNFNLPTGTTVSCTKGTTTDGRVTQIFTIAGTGTGTNGWIGMASTMTNGNFNAGDTIVCQVDVNFGTTTNVASVEMWFQPLENGVSYVFGDGKAAAGTGAQGWTLPTETAAAGSPALSSMAYSLITPPRTLTAAPTSAQMWIRVYFVTPLSGAATAGTFNFASPSCRKVQGATP